MKQVVVEPFPEAARKYGPGWAVIAVDVIRATTSAVTVASMGRPCYPCLDLEEAQRVASTLADPLLVGELAGDMPAGFHMNNSPLDLSMDEEVHRPVVLLSTSGTKLIRHAARADRVYLACFRNFSATIQQVATRHKRLAVIGAGSRGEFREEDQICCAWIADGLSQAGFRLADPATRDITAKWRGCGPEACLVSNSVRYLERTGQERDIPFILSRIDDIRAAYEMRDGIVQRCEKILSAPRLTFPEAAYANT